ncbi:hypothetical protein EV122DRAFT_271411, partial [Schizophyllum commune]
MSSEGPGKAIRKVHLPAVLPCPHPGCTAGPFRNKTVLGSHITARHRAAVLPPDEQRLRLRTSNPSSECPQSSSPPPTPSSPSPPPPNLEESASAGPSGAPRGPEDNNNDGWRPLKDGGKVRYHPVMNGRPCDKDGNFLPPNAPPPEDGKPQPADSDWSPFDSRESFQLADLLYRKGQVSAPFINELLDIWASTLADSDCMEPPFANAKDVYETIDAIPHGSAPWESFTMTFDGKPTKTEYEVFFRCPRKVLHSQLQNTDYADQMDFAPKRLYSTREKRVFSDYMSGNHPWRQADKVAEEVPEADGAVYCPAIFGSDKTTVSFYPLYMSNGLVHNTVQRGHRGAVTLIGFLSIPKTDKEHHDSATFRSFRRQLLHASLRFILLRLRPGMKTPEIVRYGDGHYRKTIYGIGPYIADYPEQVLLACIVQGCCTAHPDDLDGASTRRKHSHTDAFLDAFDAKTLWDDYGVIPDCKPFTYDFPYADIHELLTSDLLHQCIKGTFKDHLITWIFDYLELKYGKAAAERIIADIDRRIAAVPSFPGLRRFPQGRVILPAIEGYVPAQMVRAVSSLESCYLVRRNTIDEDAIAQIQAALERFHRERVIFEVEGVRPHGGFSIPRQHALVHYVHVIQEFGALNGGYARLSLSRRIFAPSKKPWRRSNRYNALRQMPVINERIDKLTACRTDFESRRMLSARHRSIAYDLPLPAATGDDEDDAGASESRRVMGEVILAKTRVRNLGPRNGHALSDRLHLPSLHLLIRRFL